jgi:hypothetical protein
MMAKAHRPVDNGLIVRLQVKLCFRISIRIPGSCIARLGLFFCDWLKTAICLL